MKSAFDARASSTTHQQKVAAVICAHNSQESIASTVRSCRAIPGVDLIIVVDDGSIDSTARHARMAGAVVVRHSIARGRASAMETGVKVAEMRDRADWPPRGVLFLTPDLGDTAAEAAALVDAVIRGRVDCAIAAPWPTSNGSSHQLSLVERIARAAIRHATGWETYAPLSRNRCLTSDAVNEAMPFASGCGIEPAMTTKLLANGRKVVEIPCRLTLSRSSSFSEDGLLPKRIHNCLRPIIGHMLLRVRVPASRRISRNKQGMAIAYAMSDARNNEHAHILDADKVPDMDTSGVPKQTPEDKQIKSLEESPVSAPIQREAPEQGVVFQQPVYEDDDAIICDSTVSMTVDTRLGEWKIWASPWGITGVTLPGGTDPQVEDRPPVEGLRANTVQTPQHWLTEASQQLLEYLDQQRQRFDLPLDLRVGTPFREDVLKAMMTIPYGNTMSYSDLAEVSGHPGSARGVGSCCAVNPVPVIIPCHRVVRSDGTAGNYAGGATLKEQLLALEGVLPSQLP